MFICLQIFDGDVRDFSRVGIYCDEASLSHVPLPIAITSTTTRLYVRFHTDDAENGVGFNATYSHINGKCLQTDVFLPFTSLYLLYAF